LGHAEDPLWSGYSGRRGPFFCERSVFFLVQAALPISMSLCRQKSEAHAASPVVFRNADRQSSQHPKCFFRCTDHDRHPGNGANWKMFRFFSSRPIFSVGLFLALSQTSHAALDVSSVNTPVTITFDSTLTGVNFGAFTGGGFEPGTSTAGRLDSDAWAVAGMSEGSLSFGGTATGGDFARGSSEEGVLFGGVYGFDTIEGGGGVNRILGIQPTGGDFTPGDITLRIQNETGMAISLWDVSYDAFEYNDSNLSASIKFSWSTDNITYTAIPGLDFSSPLTNPGGEDDWSAAASRSTTIASDPIANTGYLYLRWSFTNSSPENVLGGDQLGIDNISVAAVPEPRAFLIGGLVCGVIGLAKVGRRLFRRAAALPANEP
jgi:hypothetical protein